MIVDRIRAARRSPFCWRERCLAQSSYQRDSGATLLLLAFLAAWAAAAFGLVQLLRSLPWPREYVYWVLCAAVGYGMVATMSVHTALWCAESIMAERSSNTLDSLLLTTMDRGQLLWVRLVPRLESAKNAGVVVLAIGAVWSGCHFWEALTDPGAHRDYRSPALGLAGGLLVGALMLGQGFLSGVLGFGAAMLGRSRTGANLLVLGGGFAFCACDAAFFAFSFATFLLLVAGKHPTVLCAVPWLLVGARFLLVSYLLPTWLIERLAGRMDELLLREA